VVMDHSCMDREDHPDLQDSQDPRVIWDFQEQWVQTERWVLRVSKVFLVKMVHLELADQKVPVDLEDILVKMAKKEKQECLVYLESREDLESLDHRVVLDLKVFKEMLETEDLLVKLVQWENPDFQEPQENLADQERMDWTDYPEFLVNKVNQVAQAQLEALELQVCLDPKAIKENKDLPEFPVKWEDLVAMEKEEFKENLENKASKVFKVSPENLEDLVLPDQKVCLDLKDLLDLKETMDHKAPLDFLVSVADKESRDIREILELLDLKDLLVTLDLLESPENLDQREMAVPPENVDRLVLLVKMDSVDQWDHLAQLDPKDPVALLALEEPKVLVDLVVDPGDKVPLVKLQVIKKFWKYVAELLLMRLHAPWLDLDLRALLPVHLVHPDIPVFKETKVPLDHPVLLDKTESKDSLDFKELPDLMELKVQSEAKVIVVLLSLVHLVKPVLQDFLVLKALLVMEGMVAMAKPVLLD